MRLDKWLARSGVASRRGVKDVIVAGEVTVNGKVITDAGHRVDEGSSVQVQGAAVEPEATESYLLHKPLGVISTAADTHKRRTVVDLVPSRQRLYPVGRLDADTTGLILLSNDGELANRLTHPRYEVKKTYLATVKDYVTDDAARKLAAGVELDDGPTAPAAVQVIKRTRPVSILQITIHEGRNRQVRRMCEAIGHPVESLQRIRMGALGLGDLKPGQYRKLSETEVSELRQHAGLGR